MKNKRLDIYREYPNSLINATIDEWVHSERDRRILRYKLVDGMTYEWIAEKEDMSSRRIQDIIYAYERIVYRHLDDNR